MWVAVKVRKRIFARLFSMRDPDDAVKTMLVLRADPDERRVLLDLGHPFFRPGTGVDAVRCRHRRRHGLDRDPRAAHRELPDPGPEEARGIVAVPETGSQ